SNGARNVGRPRGSFPHQQMDRERYLWAVTKGRRPPLVQRSPRSRCTTASTHKRPNDQMPESSARVVFPKKARTDNFDFARSFRSDYRSRCTLAATQPRAAKQTSRFLDVS